MQVIIFGEKGAFAYLNGRTLPVKPHPVTGYEINSSFVGVMDPDDPGTTIDIPLKNVLLVDAYKWEVAIIESLHGHIQPLIQKQWEGFQEWAKIHRFILSAK